MPSGSYDAFISYNHSVDRPLAKSLQRRMHRLGRRWYRPSALRVFRDDTTLAANPDLWGSIDQALLASRTLVLLACPQATASPWVAREVGLWRAQRSPDTLFLVLTGGELVWDHEADDFDWQRTTALPQQLRGWFGAEPLWVDLRGEYTRRELRDKAATVTAAVHGVPKDELLSEDLQQQRRLIAVLSALLVASLVAATVAVWQRGIAIGERDRADQQARVALLRALAAESETRSQTDPQQAAQFATAAHGAAATLEAKIALARQFDLNRHTARYVRRGTDQFSTQLNASQPTAAYLEFTADGSLLAYAVPDEPDVVLWDTRAGREAGRLRVRQPGDPVPPTGTAAGLAMDANGQLLAVDDGQRVQLWDVRARKLLRNLDNGSGWGSQLAMSPDGRWVARPVYEVGGEEGRRLMLRVWRSDTGDEIPLPMPRPLSADQIAFAADNRLYVLSGDSGAGQVWELDLQTGQWRQPALAADAPAALLAIAPGAPVLATGARDADDSSVITTWNLATGRSMAITLPVSAVGLAVSDDGGTVVVATDDRRLVKVDMTTGSGSGFGYQRYPIWDVRMAADGRTVASINQGGDVLLSTLADNRILATAASPGRGGADTVVALAVSRRGDLAARARYGGGVELWELPALRLRSRLPDSVKTDISTKLAISDDSNRVAVSHREGLTVVDAHSGQILAASGGPKLAALTTTGAPDVRFGPDGRLFVRVFDMNNDYNSELRVIDQTNWTEDQRIPIKGDGSLHGSGFAVSGDGRILAAITRSYGPRVGGSEVELWRWQGSRYEGLTRIHENADLQDVAVDPAGKRIVLGDLDGRIVMIDVDNPQRRRVLLVPNADSWAKLAFTPDGSTLLQADFSFGNFGGLALVDVASGVLLATWQEDPRMMDRGEFYTLNAVIGAGPGNTALTASPDGGLVMWQIGLDVVRDQLCRIAGALPNDQRERYFGGVAVGPVCGR